jgi:hypothetical protein
MYKEAKGGVTSYLLYMWLLFLAILCLLLSSEATMYYNSYSPPAFQMRARPYYVAPSPEDVDPSVELYPMPPREVSSYAAPLIAMSADYEMTPANVPPTTSVIPTSTEPEITYDSNEKSEISTNYSENNSDVYDVTQVPLVPEVDKSSSSETTYWVLETSHVEVPYEGTTHHAPIYLPIPTSPI